MKMKSLSMYKLFVGVKMAKEEDAEFTYPHIQGTY